MLYRLASEPLGCEITSVAADKVIDSVTAAANTFLCLNNLDSTFRLLPVFLCDFAGEDFPQSRKVAKSLRRMPFSFESLAVIPCPDLQG